MEIKMGCINKENILSRFENNKITFCFAYWAHSRVYLHIFFPLYLLCHLMRLLFLFTTTFAISTVDESV